MNSKGFGNTLLPLITPQKPTTQLSNLGLLDPFVSRQSQPPRLQSIPQPFNGLIKIVRPLNEVEKKLQQELLGIANQETNPVLARILPTLDSIAFSDEKELETAVLYIDIRNSSDITGKHIPSNSAKIYKLFHRAMLLAGKKYGGQVGGFAGDRIMIVFPFGIDKQPRANAIKTGIYMQYIIQRVLNPILKSKFSHPIACGVGIDFGKMLVVRVGQQGDGNNDRIWAGHAANYASKLADPISGILVSDRIYDGLAAPAIKSGSRTWDKVQYLSRDCYKYTGINEPL